MRKLIWIAFAVMISSCKHDEDLPEPFGMESEGETQTEVLPDPSSIAGLHRNIFSVKCANPGCHDGTFEPDFRTIESSYSTLVWQPVNKFTLDSVKMYSHRAIPFNESDSWLIERIITQTSEYMPSNGVRLSSEEIGYIRNWINAGCPDNAGNVAVKPDLQPNIAGYIALDASNNRIDTIRQDGFPVNPFLVQPATNFTIAFVATDTADGAAATDPSLFTVSEIRFSMDMDDFSSSTPVQAIYFAAFSAWVVPVPVTWPSGSTVYFRIYVNDGNHTVNTEFPRQQSFSYFKTFYAFHVQ